LEIDTGFMPGCMSALENECFYGHMGHAETTNIENYQCPADTE